MSVNVVLNGQTYVIPDPGDNTWGQELTDYFVALGSGVLQKAGGTFTLTADVDFGATYGLKSAYYKSRTANVSSTGALRLAKTDFIGWRDNANASDLELGIDSSDNLTWNGNPLVPSTPLTASRAVVTDGSGILSAATTTSTEIGYVHGVTSAIQTQLDSKITAGVGAIVNADVSASAGIDFSKLAALSSARILVGSAGNVATAVDVTGDVTISNAGVTAIGNNKVTLGMMAQISTATFLGRTTASTGNVEDLTVTQATALLNAFVGDSGSGGTKGLVPAPASGDAAAGKFLKADGNWTVPAGAGDVVGPASSVASEMVLFDGTTGKLIKRATGTGLVPVTSGVYGTPGPLTGDVTTSGAGLATTAAATQANIATLSKSTGVAVHGTNTNDNASAGYIGEYIESITAPGTSFPTSGNYGDAGSLSLTAGDWDVTMMSAAIPGSSSGFTYHNCGISTTTGNASTGLTQGVNWSGTLANTTTNSSMIGATVANYRVSISSTTTYYGKVQAAYTGTAPTFGARLSARRVR